VFGAFDVGGFDIDDDGVNDAQVVAGELPTPGFTTYDLRAYWRLSQNFLLTGGVENLTDKHYLEHFDYKTGVARAPSNQSTFFQMGRNFYVGGEWTY
jgi:outer membrane receptor protein involved in Fe transport